MRSALTFSLILVTALSFAQPKKKRKTEVTYSGASLDIVFGHKTFINTFYNQLSDLNTFDFSKPVDVIGINLSTGSYAVGVRRVAAVNLSYNQFLSRIIQFQDSIEARISGFSINYGVGKIFHNSKGTMGLGMFGGFNSGLLKLTSHNSYKQGNAFFSPKIALQPKIIFFRIAISLLVEFEYDITNPKWTKMPSGDGYLYKLNDFNQSGAGAFLTVGYAIN
jgi:hypothetical protein